MENNEISTFLDRSVKAIARELKDIEPEDLLQLRAAEEEGKNRSTLIEAIDDAVADKQSDDKAPAAAGGKAARGEKTPAYQKPDYSGPLTIQQAAWRNQNIRQK